MKKKEKNGEIEPRRPKALSKWMEKVFTIQSIE